MNPQIAVLASGGGTTVEAFIRARQNKEIDVDVGLVIVSRPEAGVFERIDKLNKEFGLSIECVLINQTTNPALDSEVVGKGEQTAAEQTAILDKLASGKYDLVALMGYMKKIGPKLIEAYGWLPAYKSMYEARMLNTHPGLLPDTKAMYGQQIQQYVLDHHLPYGGQTLHLVSSDYDDGPIIAEHRVMVEPGDTAESLFERVQETEKKYLPIDIQAFIKARLAYTSS